MAVKLFRMLVLILLLASPMVAQQPQSTQGVITAVSTACALSTGCVTLLSSANNGSIGVQIFGTFTATLSFEGSVDGSNWVAIAAYPASGSAAVTSATAAGAWQVATAGLGQVRVRCSSYTSGSATVTLQSGLSSPPGASSGGGAASDVNVAQVAGTTTDTNSGNKSAGTIRTVVATDQPALVGLGIYTEDAGETAGGNLAMSGSVRRDTAASSAGSTGDNATINTDASGGLWAHDFSTSATGGAVPASASYIGSLNASGNLIGDIQCNQSANYDTNTNGSTELVALSGGTTIYVCGWNFFSAGTVNVKLITGTGTACATGSSNLTPAYQFTAQTGMVQPIPTHGYLKATAGGGALCINASAGVAVQAIVWYAQR